MDDTDYAGFWIRVFASIIDTILLLIVMIPIVTALYGDDFWIQQTQMSSQTGGMTTDQMSLQMGTEMSQGPLTGVLLNYLLPAVVILIFWMYRSATPGKMIVKIKIVDADTGDKPSTGQFIGRYLSYYISMLPFFLGFFWVAFDKRKQGFHDKLAGTAVVHTRK